jgi:hypothetical protein
VKQHLIPKSLEPILQLKKFRGFFKCLQRQYIGANWFAEANVCSTTPIRSNDAYSISWSKRKWK